MPSADTSTLTPDETLAQIFFSEEGLYDPGPFYRHLRETAPVHSSVTGAVFFTRYDDCREVLRDNRFGKSTSSAVGSIPNSDPEVVAFRKDQLERARTSKRAVSMLFLNQPHHTRQRRLVSRAFTPRRVEALRASIRLLAEDFVDTFVEAGGGDLLDTVGFPLPAAVISTMVGVPQQDWPQFRSLVTASAAGIEQTATVDELRLAETSNREVRRYFQELVIERRSRPQDDLMSDLIRVEEHGDSLSDEEIIAVSTLLFAAGFETTTNLIGNGMGALLQHPDQLAQLLHDPSLVPLAVDEMLRWDSPVQVDGRSALEPVSFGGRDFAVDARVVTLLGAANRDPELFDDPDRFDITRDQGPPMSFGSGIHHCLGANLARAEGQEVFRALLNRCRTMEQTGDLVRRRRMTLRGYEAVPVSVSAR